MDDLAQYDLIHDMGYWRHETYFDGATITKGLYNLKFSSSSKSVFVFNKEILN